MNEDIVLKIFVSILNSKLHRCMSFHQNINKIIGWSLMGSVTFIVYQRLHIPAVQLNCSMYKIYLLSSLDIFVHQLSMYHHCT